MLDSKCEEKFHKICEDDPLQNNLWISICKNLTLRLRKENDTEYGDLYVNYSAFHFGEKCSKGRIYIPEWQTHESQPILFCFLRLSIIPIDSPDKYNKIAIFPKTKREILMFSYHRIINSYKIENIIENFPWPTHKNVPNNVFHIQVPKSYSRINHLYNYLHTKIPELVQQRCVAYKFILSYKCNLELMNAHKYYITNGINSAPLFKTRTFLYLCSCIIQPTE